VNINKYPESESDWLGMANYYSARKKGMPKYHW
jgi:hypothetical protein